MVDADADSGAPSETPKPDKIYTMLENNPDVMNELARRLGVTERLTFHDVYSFYDADMLAMVPRPVHALLITVPMSAAWQDSREAEDAQCEWYKGAGAEEPILWFQQTIVHGCGLIGLLHCVCNGLPAEMIVPGTELAEFVERATPLQMDERAKLLSDSDAMYEASQSVAGNGDTRALDPDVQTGNHFVAIVKGRDNHLWELEGARKGPLDRGALSEDEDALSERALELGVKRLIDIQQRQGGDLRFSCVALCSSPSI